MSIGRLSFAIIFTLLFLSWVFVRMVLSVQFDQNCGGYLKRAADSATIEIATKELDIALRYMEDHSLTSGYTSILYRTPDEDIAFWYTNIKAAHDELTTLPKEASPLERTNVLMKLRETLLDEDSKRFEITLPSGISVYPFNGMFALWGWASSILTFLFGCLWLKDLKDSD